MCGVVGYFSMGRRPAPAAVARAVDAMRRRGPDGRGVWLSADGDAGLGHARLAVIDLDTGAQPIASEDGQVHLVLNGELYGFERIRRELEERGHRFRTRSDAEIALHLYEEEGVHALRHLRGEFALILWDARERLLFAARDRLGVKPLLFAEHDGALWLASQASALFAAGVPARWDAASMFQIASMQYPLPGATPFAGVRVLPPGHLLLAHDGRVDIRRYWDFDHAREPAPRDDREAREELCRLFDDAVRVRLRADVPVAFQLSGGIDSSAVVATAARHATGPIDAFTVSFPGTSYDELAIAAETATHVGARLHVVTADDAALAEALPGAIAAAEGFVINAHAAAKSLLARAIHDAGFKVVLTGEGADEVLAGYAHLRRDLLEDGATDASLAASNVASAGIMLPFGDGLPLTAVSRALGFVPSWLEAKASLGKRMHGLLSGDFLADFGARDACALLIAHVDVDGQLRGRGRVEQSLYLWSKTALESYILRTLGDGMEMASSIEGRLPFLDGPLVAWAAALPLDQKIRGGVEKHVLRGALGPLLPDRVRHRQKHPFLAPPMLGSHCRALLDDDLRSQSFASVPFFDAKKVVALLDGLDTMGPRERAAVDPALLLAFSAHVLHRHFQLGAA